MNKVRISVFLIFFAVVGLSLSMSMENNSKVSQRVDDSEDLEQSDLSISQQDLEKMIDEWMKNPQKDDREQRLEIMKAYYTFRETGQKLSDDQEGRVMYNQIVKMVSFDIPKTELDQTKQDVRDQLKESGFKIQD